MPNIENSSTISPLSLRVYKFALGLLLIGAPLGETVTTDIKFSIANLFQCFSAMLIFICFCKYLKRNAILILLSYIGSVVIMWFVISVKYGMNGSIEHDLYFTVCIVCILLLWAVPKGLEMQVATKKSLSIAIPITLFIIYYYTLQDLLVRGLRWTYMGFDDKSHGAIFIGCISFLVLYAYKSFIRIPCSLLVFVTSLLTVSRLFAILLPFYLVALIHAFIQDRLEISDRKIKIAYDFFAGIFVIILLGVVVYWAMTLPAVSRVFDSTSGDVTGDSTSAHILLIILAIKIKFSSVWIFIFGSSPGMFAYLLPVSGIDYSELGHLDPYAMVASLDGTLPVHSALASIFLEFPIWVFILYLALLFVIVRNHVKNKQVYMWSMVLALIAGTVWYSGHNEPYFLSLLLTSIGAMSGEEQVNSGHLQQQSLKS